MQINLTWWVMPLLFTILSFAIAWAKAPNMDGNTQFDFFTPLLWLGCYVVALIASLLSWLVYFIIF